MNQKHGGHIQHSEAEVLRHLNRMHLINWDAPASKGLLHALGLDVADLLMAYTKSKLWHYFSLAVLSDCSPYSLAHHPSVACSL
jgi:hypothetical protein